jgi:Flp pilus assembly protein TadB
MSDTKQKENEFIKKEYIEVTIQRELASLCSDCYRALGWTVTDTRVRVETTTLSLERDRKIKNRTALSELQHKCENAFHSIEKLERAKEAKALIVSLSVGVTAAVMMTGAVFAFLAARILFGILLAVPALIGMLLPVFLYRKYLKESTEKINSQIETYYDMIYEACDKANHLLDY